MSLCRYSVQLLVCMDASQYWKDLGTQKDFGTVTVGREEIWWQAGANRSQGGFYRSVLYLSMELLG